MNSWRFGPRGLAVLCWGAALVVVGCTPGGGGPTSTTTPDRPVAVASASPAIGDAPLSVSFDSNGSSVGTGTDLTYSWDFGEGAPVVGGPTATHVYHSPGTYSARLTMETTKGTSTSPAVTIQVNVDPQPKYYVRPSGTDDSDCGPLLDPCSSLSHTIDRAVSADIHVIRVAGGNYQGPIHLVSGMQISGGWAQDFSDFGAEQLTTIYGTATQPAVIADGVSGASLTAVSAQGVVRSEGDAVGVLITGGSSEVIIGNADTPRTVVGGGVGPNATGILVAEGSSARVVNTTATSGTTVGAGSSAYGIRAIGQSVVRVTLSEVTAQPGNSGASATDPAPTQADAGSAGERGDNACGAGCPGIGGDGGK